MPITKEQQSDIRKAMKFALIFAVVVVVGLFASCAAILSAGKAGIEKAQSTSYPVGTAYTDSIFKDLTVKVVASERNSTIAAQTASSMNVSTTAAASYLKVIIEWSNHGNEPASPFTGNLTIKTAEGQQYKPFASVEVKGKVAPGLPQQAEYLYQLPADSITKPLFVNLNHSDSSPFWVALE